MIRHIVAGSLFVSMIACLHCQTETVSKTEAVGAVECSGESCPLPTTKAKVEDVGNIETVKSEVCPEGMVEIDANYCPKTDEYCLKWQTIDGTITKTMTGRCAEYRSPVHCLVPTIHKHFCMAKYEGQNKKGELPRDWVSYNEAKKLAEADGNRLCTDVEWITAASGNEFRPLPYGDGFHRTHECNIDQHVHGVDIMHVSDPNSEGAAILRSHVVPSGSMDRCISSTGVMDLAGNLDESLTHESGVPYVSCLMGGFWGGVRNRSTAETTAHSPEFRWYEVSWRACRDVQAASDEQETK